jgi:hypothetical protein
MKNVCINKKKEFSLLFSTSLSFYSNIKILNSRYKTTCDYFDELFNYLTMNYLAANLEKKRTNGVVTVKE